MLDADFLDSDSFFKNGIESEGERLHRRHDIGELVLKIRNDLYVVTQNTLYAFIGEKRERGHEWPSFAAIRVSHGQSTPAPHRNTICRLGAAFPAAPARYFA